VYKANVMGIVTNKFTLQNTQPVGHETDRERVKDQICSTCIWCFCT